MKICRRAPSSFDVESAMVRHIFMRNMKPYLYKLMDISQCKSLADTYERHAMLRTRQICLDARTSQAIRDKIARRNNGAIPTSALVLDRTRIRTLISPSSLPRSSPVRSPSKLPSCSMLSRLKNLLSQEKTLERSRQGTCCSGINEQSSLAIFKRTA